MIAEDISERIAVDPFSVLRGRAVLGRMALAILATIALAIPVWAVEIIIFKGRGGSPLVMAFLQLCSEGFLVFFILRLLRRAGLHPKALLGRQLEWIHLRRCWTLPALLGGVTMTGFFVVFVAMAFVMPGAIEWLLHRRMPDLIDTTGSYPLTNLFDLLSVVFVAPIVEEYIFRGLLLTRWSLKWGTPRAILLTSAIFGVLHAEMIGHAFFGYVMAVLYIKTRSLYVPIAAHGANNAIAWMVGLFGPSSDPTVSLSVTKLQSLWPAAVFFSALFIPLAIRFIWRHYPTTAWKMPYTHFRG